MLDPSQIVHWTLYHAEHADRVTCVERVIPNGSECSVLYDGLPVATRVLHMGRDVAAWADEIRRSWESAGWLTSTPRQTSASLM